MSIYSVRVIYSIAPGSALMRCRDIVELCMREVWDMCSLTLVGVIKNGLFRASLYVPRSFLVGV